MIELEGSDPHNDDFVIDSLYDSFFEASRAMRNFRRGMLIENLHGSDLTEEGLKLVRWSVFEALMTLSEHGSDRDKREVALSIRQFTHVP